MSHRRLHTTHSVLILQIINIHLDNLFFTPLYSHACKWRQIVLDIVAYFSVQHIRAVIWEYLGLGDMNHTTGEKHIRSWRADETKTMAATPRDRRNRKWEARCPCDERTKTKWLPVARSLRSRAPAALGASVNHLARLIVGLTANIGDCRHRYNLKSRGER